MVGKGVRVITVFASIWVVCFSASDSARAQDGGLFAGKRIVMVLANRPGGGTDAIGRMFGSSLVKHLPGKPSIIFKNMPGAGGIKAANHVYAEAAADGMTMVTGGGNAFDPVRLKKKSVRYDPVKFQYFVAFSNPTSVLIMKGSAAPRLQSPSGQRLHMAAIDGTRSSIQMVLWGGVALGWNLRLVTGYRGTQAMLLALQRGEVELAANNFPPAIKPILASGKFSAVAQTGDYDNGKVIRGPDFPNVPTVAELVAGKLKGQSQQAFNLWQGRSIIGKFYALPPKTPARYVNAYRAAADEVIKDKAFQQRAIKVVGTELKKISPQELLAMIVDMVNTKPDTLAYLDDLVQKYRK